MIRTLLLFSLLLLPFTSAVGEEPLPPDEAFRFHAEAVDASTIRAEWTLAPGYYLYRHRVRFESGTEGITLGEIPLPKGKEKTDEFFGDIETYYQKLAVEIPIERSPGSPDTLILIAHSQGCSEPLGLCYPPHEQQVTITLPPLSSKSEGSAAPAGLTSLAWGGQSQEEALLEPDQAFAISAEMQDANRVKVHWQIAEGYYLYRDKFQVTVIEPQGVRADHAQLPAGEKKQDEFFGEMEVYHGRVEAIVPLNGLPSGNLPAPLVLEVRYQGCSETLGVCYPPMSKRITLEPPPAAEAKTVAATVRQAAPPSSRPALSEQDSLANTIATGSTVLTVITFFGLGLLLAFTPCGDDHAPGLPDLSGLCARHGIHLHGGRGHRRPVRGKPAGHLPEPLDSGYLQPRLRIAGPLHVRLL